MTRTQLKDARRNIRRQFVSYISIVVIAMIAVLAYLGIALGLLVGNRIALGIVKLVEQPYLSFVREPDVRTFVFCRLITSGFSLAINGFALRKIKSLKLSDAL